jgi:hypothetical protein
MPAIFTATSGDDVTVTCTKPYVDTHGRGYRKFNQHEPKADTTKLRVGELQRRRYCQGREGWRVGPVVRPAGQVTPRLGVT